MPSSATTGEEHRVPTKHGFFLFVAWGHAVLTRPETRPIRRGALSACIRERSRRRASPPGEAPYALRSRNREGLVKLRELLRKLDLKLRPLQISGRPEDNVEGQRLSRFERSREPCARIAA